MSKTWYVEFVPRVEPMVWFICVSNWFFHEVLLMLTCDFVLINASFLNASISFLLHTFWVIKPENLCEKWMHTLWDWIIFVWNMLSLTITTVLPCPTCKYVIYAWQLAYETSWNNSWLSAKLDAMRLENLRQKLRALEFVRHLL